MHLKKKYTIISNFFQKANTFLYYFNIIPPQCKRDRILRKINLFKKSCITNIALWLASSALTAHDRTVRHRVQIFHEKKTLFNIPQKQYFMLWLCQFLSSVTDFTVK